MWGNYWVIIVLVQKKEINDHGWTWVVAVVIEKNGHI